MSDLMIERLERAAKYCPLESELMLSAKAVIEQQQKRIAELEVKTSCCMGVGNGNGRLFVYGDHESIKTAQRYVLEREELAATVERLQNESDLLNALVWFERDDVKGLDENQAGVINLNAVRREAFIEGFNAGFTDCWIVDEEEHADAAIEIANQHYPD